MNLMRNLAMERKKQMIKFEHTEVVGWKHAIRGMRNPMNSHEKSDSGYGCDGELCGTCSYADDVCDNAYFQIGPNDLDLMKRLVKAGTDHRKFMRMIVVYVDITAPLYWWKEMDQYRIGVTTNSYSTMHKIHEKEFNIDDFSHEHILCGYNSKAGDFTWGDTFPMYILESTITNLNFCRRKYLETKDKRWWYQMIQLLPSSYNQKRTVMLNYEVLANIYKSRRNHKLDEWVELCKWIETLPYSELIAGLEI